MYACCNHGDGFFWHKDSYLEDIDFNFDCFADNSCLFDISGISLESVSHMLSISSSKILSSSSVLIKFHFFADVMFCIYIQSISLI